MVGATERGAGARDGQESYTWPLLTVVLVLFGTLVLANAVAAGRQPSGRFVVECRPV